MHKDASDRAITKGDLIAYSTGLGRRSSGIRFAAVIALKEKQTTSNVWNDVTKQYDSVPDVEYKVQVISAEHSRQYDYSAKKWNEGWRIQGKDHQGQGKARLATLDRLERTIVVQPHQVHPEARALLEKEMTERGIA